MDSCRALANTLVSLETPGFWEQLLTDHSLDGLTDLEKLLAGFEIIIALDELDLLSAC